MPLVGFAKFFLILLVILLIRVYSLNPPFRLADPKPFSVNTDNTIRMLTEIIDTSIHVKSIRFYAVFPGRSPSVGEQGVNKVLVGEIKRPPYEVFWDCANVPDLDMWRLHLYSIVEDDSGRLLDNYKEGHVLGAVLDRHTALSSACILSSYTNRSVKIDGFLDEWSSIDSVSSANSNNRVLCKSMWDEQNLYLAVKVHDENLNAFLSDTIHTIFFDGISLFFDPRRERGSLRLDDDRQLNVGVLDTIHGNIAYPSGDTIYNRPFETHCIKAVQVSGTLNDNTDSDSGFVIELALPWSDLDILPKTGDSIGFDVFNSDNDQGQRWRVGKGWCGTEISNNNNPSEWGTLVLVKKNTGKQFAVLGFAIVVGLLFVVFGIYRKKSKTEQEPEKPVIDGTAERIIQFIKENSREQELSLEIVAEKINVSSRQVRKVLKEATGFGFSEYLAMERITVAKAMLLKEKNLNISQIAFTCGFNSADYFTKTFRKYNNGQTPTEFRAVAKDC